MNVQTTLLRNSVLIAMSFFLQVLPSLAQDNLESVVVKSSHAVFKNGEWVYEQMDIEPSYPGGYPLLYKTVGKNIRFPYAARRLGTEGRVFALFEIDTLGSLSHAEVLGDTLDGLGQAAISVLDLVSEDWIPAEKDGEKYKTRFVLPMIFSLGISKKLSLGVDLPVAYKLSEIVITAQGSMPGGSGNKVMRIQPPSRYSTLKEAVKNRNHCKFLELRSQNLDSLPVEVYLLKNLRVLDIKHNQLPKLENPIAKLSKLQSLLITDNKITELPDSIVSLTTLTSLNLNTNKLDEFPPEILSLTKLELLDLGNNSLDTIPYALSTLKKLHTLNLANNQLTSVPNSIFELKNLKFLYLYGNNIPQSELAVLLDKLPNLQLVF